MNTPRLGTAARPTAGPWAKARSLAEATPASRNRYVDFLRALSILAVVLGHWIIAGPVLRDGDLATINLLAAEPWTQWLTWGFQVMPIFFVVGGYSNAASWRAARSRRETYGAWLTSRLRRLVLPAVPLVAAWSGFAIVARAVGIDGSMLRLGSQVALIPLWFLAVYVLVVALNPLTLSLWDRYGYRSVAGIAAVALVIDVAAAQTSSLVGWANFVFVWAAVHQLGYAWRDGRLGSTRVRLAIGAIGAAVLVALVTVGPYPLSMVGVPGAAATNNSPPTIALIALGVAQMGVLLALESRAVTWLSRPRAWAATILVNGSIMTLYLWHLTAMVGLVGISLLAGGAGLGLEPGTASWWWSRPVWLLVLAGATLPFLAGLGRFERSGHGSARSGRTALVVAGLACLGFASIAGGGIANAGELIRPVAVLPVLAAGLMLTRTRNFSSRSPSPTGTPHR